MKLRYLFATLAAALTIFAGCEPEADHFLEEVQVSSSYLAFPAGGGSVPVTVTAIADWTVKDLPEWISASAKAGAAGESTVNFTATAATETREASFSIECAGKSQTINAIQVTEKVEPKLTSMKDVIEAGAGNFRICGTVTKIANTSYGNWYLNDGTTDANGGLGIYVYGTLDKKGNTWSKDPAKENINCPGNPDAWEFAVGDKLTVEGPYSFYNGTTPEMVDVTVISIERSLISVDSIELLGVAEGAGVTEFPKEGGSIKVTLKNKGEGFHVVIPEEAKSWLHIEDFGSDYVTLTADANEGGDRKVSVSFTTTADGVAYSCEQEFTQPGAILEVSISDFLAAEVGDTQFRLTGVVSADYPSDSQGQSFYIKDWSGETLVYRLNDFKASGAKLGDIITVVGKRGAYKESPQMVNGVYEKHIPVTEISIADFLGKPDDKNTYYMVTGTITSLLDSKGNENDYGNMYISDGTNELYLYGLYPGWGASGDNRKGFVKAAGIKVGDKLTSIGYKDTYSGLVELCGGIYVKHEAGEGPGPETPETLFLNEFDTQNKKLEIYNPNDKEVNIAGWQFVKDGGLEEKDIYTIPASLDASKVPAKGYAVFTCKQADAANGPLFGLSGTKGFKIELKKGDTVVDVADNLTSITEIPDGKSWGRETDGAPNFVVFDTPSIGGPNGGVIPDTFDYTPSAAYLASGNLWKPVEDAKAQRYFYSVNPDWAGQIYSGFGTDLPPYVEFKQSTYKLNLETATSGRWQNQFFVHPNDGSEIPLDPAKSYKFSVTVQSTTAFNAFFKVVAADASKDNREGGTIWEPAGDADPSNIFFEAGKPIVLENVIEGVEAPSINVFFDLGGNPAGTVVYIKDITLVEVGGGTPSVTDFIALPDGTEGKFAGTTAALGKSGFIVTDGTTNLYVYQPESTPAIGDNVIIEGTKTTYYGLIEVSKGAKVTVESSGNAIPVTAVKDITSTFDAYPDSAPTSDLIKFEGTVSVSGSYTNIIVDGATARQGSPQGLDVSAYDGKKLTLTGYYIGTSGSGGKFLNIIVTEFKENGASGDAKITIDGNFDDWTDVPGAEPAAAFNAFKVTNDADNFYFYIETDPGSRLWSGGGYLYLYFNFKNDLTQGEYGGATGMHDNKYDAYIFMYLFGGSADAPKIEDNPNGGEAKGMTLDNIVIAGNQPATASDIVKMEIVIPRANFTTQVKAGDVIAVDSYRSKDGGNVYFPGYVVK